MRVNWLSPADGAVLRAGETVRLAWAESPGASLPVRADEWEIFLSVDGGRTWSVRLTPHLDLARRSFTFRVPDLPTPFARLLLRVGDERREHEIPLPARLQIVRAGHGSPAPAPTLWPALRAGERARPGQPGVAMWVAGGRSGRASRWFAHLGSGARLEPAIASGFIDFLPLAPPRVGPQVPRGPLRGVAQALSVPAGTAPPSRCAAGPAPPVPHLQATCRLNT